MSVFSKKTTTLQLCALVTVLFFTTSTVADVQLTRTGNVNCTGYFGEEARIGISFTTGPLDYQLQSVTTDLYVREESPSAAAGYAIHEDDAGFPGTLIEDMGLTSLIPPGVLGNFTLNSAGTMLDANTTYWLVYTSTAKLDLVGASASTTTSSPGWALGTQWLWLPGYQRELTCGFRLSINALALQIFLDGFE